MEYSEAALQNVRETRLLIDRYDAWIFNEFKPYLGRRVIELGSGLGNLFPHLLDREFVLGIEPSEANVIQVQEQYAAHKNIRNEVDSITDPEVLRWADERFDTAVSLNVFEHIDDDELAIEHTFKLLQPGGTFIIIVPAHAFLYGPMDQSIGHYRRYTKASLKEKLERHGFRVVHQKYLNMLGGIGWLVNGRILRKQVPPAGQLRLLNRLIPIQERMEKIIRAPFGVSVLTVGKVGKP